MSQGHEIRPAHATMANFVTCSASPCAGSWPEVRDIIERGVSTRHLPLGRWLLFGNRQCERKYHMEASRSTVRRSRSLRGLP